MQCILLDNYENFVKSPKKKGKKRKLFIHLSPTEVSIAKTTLLTCINRHCGLDCSSYRHYGDACRRVLVSMATGPTSYRGKYYNLPLLSIQYHKSYVA